MFFVGKNFILHREVHTCAVNQVYNRQAIFHCYFLSTEIFFTRDRKPSAGFYSGIIGHHNTLFTAYVANYGYNTTCGAAAMFFIHALSGKRTHFKTRTVSV